MSEWQPPRREPKKTKAELREMLAKAVRNTAEAAAEGQERSRPRADQLLTMAMVLEMGARALPNALMDRAQSWSAVQLDR
jgi:hypothetical protein